MKKLLSISLLLLSVCVYLIASSDYMIAKIAKKKYQSNSWWSSDKYRFGDLYGMSYKHRFKNKEDTVKVAKAADSGQKKIQLFALGDSYLWSFYKSEDEFYGVYNCHLLKSNYNERISTDLDSNKCNVLLIELAERNILSRLKDTAYMYGLVTLNAAGKKGDVKISDLDKDAKGFFGDNYKNFFFNPKFDTNLEFLLWECRLFTPLKEIKTLLSEKLTGNKGNDDVVTSEDGTFLFFKPTVDSTSGISSFGNIRGTCIDSTVNLLNRLADHYRKIGFDRVVFSFVPNPVSVISPNYHGMRYNNLVSRIQNHPELKAKTLDIYNVFRQQPTLYYYTSDSHWNYKGYNAWLGIVNEELKQIGKAKQ